ncbi:lactoylglutathione lyase [Halalkaliarchaeum desulfuricum]|uniref:Lactoylglutathione lyase n=1 Tax=Halalkaliarchaeum desulfuricum TaxID=2055893 RepID=A0A343TLC0_9EURY|nr:VOC family protein [Halalkaliarchaeum desulfuricum]AUX09892.1 lactoylglutathione lyase [Halalkaliarchaeum desulfuricum]
MDKLSVHHVGIVVSDLEASLEFYRDTLGLSVADEFTLSDDGIGTAIGVDGVSGDFVHLEGNGARVELIEYDPTGVDSRADAINGLGAKHVGFAVEDLQEFYENLPDDVEPLSSPQPVEIGTSILFFRDPDGNFLEVVEA